MAEYTKLFLIGSGSYGKVWVVERNDKLWEDRKVLKEVSLSGLKAKDINQAITEVEVLAECNHENIIKYSEAFVNMKETFALCIVMEYAVLGDLHKCITQRNGLFFPDEIISSWLTQIMSALDYIHFRGILHRDVKPQNLFLTDQDTLKLGDFGIAKVLEKETDKASTFIGTPFYLSPEVYNQKPYSFKSDMWSAGCVLYELCCLRVPFTASSLGSLACKIEGGLFSPLPSHYDPSLHRLVKWLLEPNSEDRPSAKDVLEFLQVKRKESLSQLDVDGALSPGCTPCGRGRNRLKQSFSSKVNSATYTVVKHPKVKKLSMASPELSTMLHHQRTQSAERHRSADADPSHKARKRAPCFNILQSHADHDVAVKSAKREEKTETERKKLDPATMAGNLGHAIYELYRSSQAGLQASDILDCLENALGRKETEQLVKAVKQRETLKSLNSTVCWGDHQSVLPLVLLYVKLQESA